MRVAATVAVLLSAVPGVAAGGPASGTVKSATGTIAPKFATAYVVRDSRRPREAVVELLLTEVPVNAAALDDDLDRHVRASARRACRASIATTTRGRRTRRAPSTS